MDVEQIEKGTKLSEAPKTTREGYTFVGWFYHGQAYNFDTPINDNLVLVAKWK